MGCRWEQELAYILEHRLLEEKAFSDMAALVANQDLNPLTYLHQMGVISAEKLVQIQEEIDARKKMIVTAVGRDFGDDDRTMVKPRSKPGQGTEGADDVAPVDAFDETIDAIDTHRFRILGRLGKGGMGIVYKAYDYHLERNVAIKVLISRDSESVARFIREARAQACVDHEHICKVFEVGQSSRNPFIVMQYIDGAKLNQASEAMSLEQRLLVMKQISYGVHEAHRMGLIHRDIKPANIMVMRTEEGRYRPFVLDFGLAKFNVTSDHTVVGDIIGTPAFMAPEQALGHLDKLDRRTDVYALGATMYCILTGKAPVKGDSGGEVLLNLQNEDPVPPRKLVPEIPKDVEVITMKCLARDPANRYPSARALAEDLGRFLDGDPIEAKPLSFLYRLHKKVLKHKAISALATIAVVISLAFLAYMASTRWQVAERERLATVFTERVEEVEAISRHAYLSRRHDIREDWERLERNIKTIREEMSNAGGMGESLGHYALGKARLILGDPETAEQHLETAWAKGNQSARVAGALGLALGERYRDGLEAVQVMPSKVDRERRRRELEQAYLERARMLIRRGAQVEGQSQEYLEALLAYYDGDYESALRVLEHGLDAPAWFYEAEKLKGDIYRDRAIKLSESGQGEVAKSDFDKALNAYAKAREIGESDPRIYRSRGNTFLKMMSVGVFSKENLQPYLNQGLKEVAWALEVLPDDSASWLLKAKLHRHMAQQLKVEARDPLHQLQLARDAGQCALLYGADVSPIHLELGAIYWRWAQWLDEKREPSDEMRALTLDHLLQVAPKDQTFNYFHTLGTVEFSRANSLVRTGRDARSAYGNAISMFRSGLELAPDQFGLYNSIAVCLFRLSEQKGIEQPPTQLLEESIDALEAALKINPNHVVLHYQMGRTYFRLAQNGKPLVGNLEQRHVEKALDHYNRALEINPKMIHLYNVLGMVYYFRGIYAWEAGESPEPWFAQAVVTYEKGLALAPNSRRLHQNMGWVYYYAGKFKLRQGLDPRGDFLKAEKRLEKAIAQGKDVEAILCKASIERLKAEYAFANQLPFKRHQQEAAKDIRDILEINPNYPEAYRSMGRLYTLMARESMLRNEDPQIFFAEGRKALSKALELEPNSPYFHLADARWYLQKALWELRQGRKADALAALGQESVAKALALRPAFAEAKLAETVLERIKQEGALNEQQTHAAFEEILATNPHLAYEWKPLMAFLL